jgi:hypothetical protein
MCVRQNPALRLADVLQEFVSGVVRTNHKGNDIIVRTADLRSTVPRHFLELGLERRRRRLGAKQAEAGLTTWIPILGAERRAALLVLSTAAVAADEYQNGRLQNEKNYELIKIGDIISKKNEKEFHKKLACKMTEV